MPTLKKCEKCGREGGYAVHENDEVCARCAQSEDTDIRREQEETKQDNTPNP